MTANYLFRNQGGFGSRRPARSRARPPAPTVVTRRAWASPAATSTATAARPGRDQLLRRIDHVLSQPGRRLFADHTAAIGLAAPTRRLLGFGIAFLDVNNDGRLDLLYANGHVLDARPQYPLDDAACSSCQASPDGRLDRRLGSSRRAVLVRCTSAAGWPSATSTTTAGSTPSSSLRTSRSFTLHNQTRAAAGHFIELRPGGDEVEPRRRRRESRSPPAGRRRVAERVGGGSYQSASDPRLHFGLGAADEGRLGRGPLAVGTGRSATERLVADRDLSAARRRSRRHGPQSRARRQR